MRIGQGYDVHALGEGSSLRIGGISLPYHKQLVGHSDADVLLHAIMDAMLGALGQGDIGMLFPPSDEQYRGCDSTGLLRQVCARLGDYTIANVDSTVIAQKPLLSPHYQAMRESIASCLEIGVERVSVKATTTERLGWEGREEGIAASAIVLLVSGVREPVSSRGRGA